MRIVDLKCAVIGDNPIVRIATDEGLSGYGAVESYNPYLKSHVLMYKPYILDTDPTQVERVMLNIRHRGSFKPWGSAVSAIEIALIVDHGFIDVVAWTRPGIGLDFNVDAAKADLRPNDSDFFD